MAKKALQEKNQPWKRRWKNVGWFGRLNRLVAGVALLYGAGKMKDNVPASGALAAFGGYLVVVGGLLGWCSLRALLKKPTGRAFRRHYPD